MTSLLPLFPLDVVLFPNTPLPLHIFEPRYKEMIGECLANHSAFGVVRAAKEGVAEIGCTAEIIAVTKKYPDGRLDIVTEGRSRFAIMQLNHDRSFLQAEVRLFEDNSASAAREDTDRAVRLHAEILSMAGATQDISGADPGQLSFTLAASLPLDLEFKQSLLGLRSERERIAALNQHLEAALPNLRRAASARRAAGGNGRVH